MKNLKRYDLTTAAGIQQRTEGQYVLFSDYLKERQSLTSSRDHLKGIVDEIASVVKRDQNKETLLGAVKRVADELGRWRKVAEPYAKTPEGLAEELQHMDQVISRQVPNPNNGSALEKRIRDAMELSENCKASYAKNGHGNQYNYARGQIDSFQAVLNWMSEAQKT